MESLTELAAEEVPSKKLFIFTEALKKAASMTIPLRVLRTNENPYMNYEIKCLMKERNRLRRNLALNRTAWLQECKEVAEKVEEAKRMSWRNHLEIIKVKKDARLAWRTVRGLKSKEQQPTGEALQYRGRLYHRDQAKANAFIQEYASVSSRTSDRVSRLAVKQHRQDMQSLLRCPRRTPEQAFHQDKFQSAFKKIKVGKTAGPAEIAPDLFKHLPADVEVELLKILTHSWLEGFQSWRDVVIIPFFKKDKDPQSVDSYRPIALTSTICKLLERMIVNRLSWWFEEHLFLSLWQAGFRKGRSTVDQCFRLSQHISDGFQSERLRTGMTLFDFSKAYDRVWRTGLLQKMHLLGIPARFLVWISSWLTSRQARVRVNARLTLNTNKCEVSFFSLCTAEASWQPHITIRGLPLSFNAAPIFLGVQYDRQLTFSEHAKKVCQAMTKRTNILRALGGTTWGWQPVDLRTIYIATQRPLAEYGSQAWAPWLSKSNLGKLESAQLNAARAITGHLRSTR